MLDVGMIVSGAVIVLVVVLADRWIDGTAVEDLPVLDRLYMPLLGGVLVGRIVALGLDDPTSLGSFRSILVIRGGVEFWPGVAAFTGVVLWSGRRRSASAVQQVAGLLPFALWGYATYEATCGLRDGCFGPPSPIGLVPPGLLERQFPVGLVMGVAVAGLGGLLRRKSSLDPAVALLAAVAGVALVRSTGSVWLPHLGDGLTRQHLQSLAVLAACGLVAVVGHLVRRRASTTAPAQGDAPAAASSNTLQ